MQTRSSQHQGILENKFMTKNKKKNKEASVESEKKQRIRNFTFGKLFR